MSDVVIAGVCTALFGFTTVLRISEGRLNVATGIFGVTAIIWFINFVKQLMRQINK